MENERAIEILDPEHREAYESLEPVNEACRMGVVAKRMGRGFVGCEINPSYVEMAARRIAEVE